MTIVSLALQRNLFNLQAIHNSIRFTAHGFFVLDETVFVTVFSMTVSYAIILFQLRKWLSYLQSPCYWSNWHFIFRSAKKKNRLNWTNVFLALRNFKKFNLVVDLQNIYEFSTSLFSHDEKLFLKKVRFNTICY